MTIQALPDNGRPAPSYDELVRSARLECAAQVDELDPHQVEAFWGHVERSDALLRRRLLVVRVGLAVLVAIGLLNIAFPMWPGRTCVGTDAIDVAVVVALPMAAVLLSMVLMHSRSAGAQMLLRALLWSTALLGALASVLEPGVVPVTSACAGVVCGGALLILGQHGLEPERYTGSFAPIAHRGVLTMMMILAVADAQTLVSWTNGSYWESPAAGVCGLAMTAGIVGLSRLKLWGLLLSAMMSLGIAVVALLGWLDLPGGVVALLSVTAAVQACLAALVLHSVGRGMPTELPQLARWGARLVWLVIACVMATSVAGLLFATPDHAGHARGR